MEEYVALSLSLLSIERAAEVAESESVLFSRQQSFSRPASRAFLEKLSVASQKVGLYGRHVVTLEACHRAKAKIFERALPTNSITNGDIVGLFSGGKPIAGQQISGVVTRSTGVQVSIVFDDLSDTIDLSAHNGMIQLVRLANDVTYRRIKRALESLQSYLSGRCLHLISALFSQSSLLPAHEKYTSLLDRDLDTFPYHTPGLNSSQRRAVVSVLSRPDVAVIHGPPGTGKTTTVVEVILQAVDLEMKVLACAPSNVAVDNIVERLADAKAKVVRIGHPARLVPAVVQYSLDALVVNSDSAGIILDVRHDIDKAYTSCMKARSSEDKRKWRSEVKALRRELKQREERCLKETLSSADVVLSTLTGSSPEGALRFLPDDHFDLVVIDECAQALEASCWIPLLRAPRCVLAGDHCQLPPTILSQEAADKGLSLTLMERLVKEFGDSITSTLTTQYRMHAAIMTWPSHMLYHDTLVAHDTVANHLLSDLPDVSEVKETSVPLVFIDTAGCGLHELETEDGDSKGNEGEADLVVHHIKKLHNSGVLDKDIAVIAPYSLQVDLIRQRVCTLPLSAAGIVSQLEVRTVDGFQGREKEAMIISLTRSNDKGEYGFLKEQRRINVAVTRARRHLCLIGDSDTVSHEPFMKGMIEHCLQSGEVWSAHEYLQDSVFVESHYYQARMYLECKEKTKNLPKRAESRPKLAATVKPTFKNSATLEPSLHTYSSETIESSKKTKIDFMKVIGSFLETSDEDVQSFPPSLTGNERKIIHEEVKGFNDKLQHYPGRKLVYLQIFEFIGATLCEQFGLLHESQGQGKERFIQIRKIPKDTASEAACTAVEQHNLEHISPSSEEVPPVSLDSKERTCDTCRRVIPLLNWDLHHIQCVKTVKSTQTSEHNVGAICLQPSEAVSKKILQRLPKPKHASKKSPKAKLKKEPGDEDLDALLAEMKLADSTCKFQNCPKNVSLLGVLCQFCKERYCTKHSVAEVHGCGEVAKLQSRKDLQQEVKRGGKCADLCSVKRSQLHMKLSKKLEEKTTERQSKTKSKGQK